MEAREMFLEGNLAPGLRAQLLDKWKGMVKDVNGKRNAENTAMILENQMVHMKGMMNEAMSTTAVAEYTKFIFPLIRNVWPNLIANNVASVQPMDGPIGAIAFYKNIYGTTKGTITKGDVFPKVDHFDPTYSKAETFVENELLGTGDTSARVTTFFKQLSRGKINPGTLSVTAGSVTAIDDGNGGLVGEGVVAGVVNYETGVMTVVFVTGPSVGTPVTASYSYPVENTDQGISSVEGDLDIIPVRAGSRKLVSLYSVETAEDMKALWGTDAEADLVSASGSQVALEVDRELVGMIYANVKAAHSTTWDYVYDPTTSQITLQDHIRTLIARISSMSQKVYKATLKQQANWIITSPEIIAFLDQLPEFVSTLGNLEFQLGIQKAGTLNGKWLVYSDPFLTSNVILVGYKGPGFADSGICYAPYIPIQLTPTFFNPTSFQMSKGIRTRYAAKILSNNYFGKVTVTNMPF